MAFSTDERVLKRIYRRKQFVLGPRPVEEPEGWRAVKIAGGNWLVAHLELGVLTATSDDLSLTLLGYILDPNDPNATDADVVQDLAERVSAGADLFKSLGTLAGRYLLLLARPGHAPLLVGDAAGTLTVFHCRVDGETWCAATADLLADEHGLQPDPEAAAYISQRKAQVEEFAWPVDTTLYSEVRRLLPNHYLDLASGSVHRYWPVEPLAQRSVQDVARSAAVRMQAVMAAGARRFDLVVGVSAGLDSRLMLASTAGSLERIEFYSGLSKTRGPNHPDLAIPRRMLAGTGAKHHVIPNDGVVDASFADVFNASLPLGHPHRVAGLSKQLEYFKLTRVATLGNVSENARSKYLQRKYKQLPPAGLTAEYCGYLEQMEGPFEVRAYARWLEGAPDVPGYDKRDLLFWESRTGSWFASNISEFVIAWQEVFLPYNCRALLTDLMSAPLESRVIPVTRLYLAVANELWPALTRFDVNPKSVGKRLRDATYLGLRGIKRGLMRGLKRRSLHAA
ncbi:MAG: hypothetical protein KF813_13675 [Trueperaceae bacterium]|nr:hypothetical protein [Trueperaceae bacterium]